MWDLIKKNKWEKTKKIHENVVHKEKRKVHKVNVGCIKVNAGCIKVKHRVH